MTKDLVKAMKLPTREEITASNKKRASNQRYYKTRALMVIEAMCMGDNVFDNVQDLQAAVYKVAHAAVGCCDNPHKEWRENTEKTFKNFQDLGLI